MRREVRRDGRGSLEIRFPYEPRMVALVREVPGRQWNQVDKIWSVPEGSVIELVERLRPEGFRFCELTVRLYRERGGALELDEPDGAPARAALIRRATVVQRATSATSATRRAEGEPNDFTVSRLNQHVDATLRAAIQAPLWLVGEVSGFNKGAHKSIVGFELIERDDNGGQTSQIKATLFESARFMIERRLRAAGSPFRLEDEIKIRVRGRVEVYVPWGLYRFVVEDIDPTYTLGEAARRREEIRRRLIEQGILERNRSLPLPRMPLRVGLITALDSDAYNDVLRTLQESGFAFHIVVYGARVQGRYTEPSVLNALDELRARRAEIDVALICRGGGSSTDLAWFDAEPIARAVALFPVPVLIGIGHEKDISALDFVARRAKTPTAAAGMLVEQVQKGVRELDALLAAILDRSGRILRDEVRENEDRASRLAIAARALLDEESAVLGDQRRRAARGTNALLRAAEAEIARRASQIPKVAARYIERRAGRLSESVQQLRRGAARDLAAASRRVAEVASNLGPRSARLLALETERAEGRGRRLRILDPRRVVERGYAILRAGAGEVLVDPARAPRGMSLIAELKMGMLRLRSEGPDEE